jgi:hypothetical protein
MVFPSKRNLTALAERGARAEAARREKVTPSCGCVFCDIDVGLEEDAVGFFHLGPHAIRIACPLRS